MKNEYIPDKIIIEALQELEKGVDINFIADRLRVSSQTIRTWAIKSGIIVSKKRLPHDWKKIKFMFRPEGSLINNLKK